MAGLLSPTTGIVSAHGLMDALLHEARRHGAILQPRAELVAIERRDRDYRLEIRTPDGTESLTSERVVNAAGLDSDTVAALAGIDVAAAGYRLHWWKGSYFAVVGTQGEAPLAPRLPRPHPREPRRPRRARARRPRALRARRRPPSRPAGRTTPWTRGSERSSARPSAASCRRSSTRTSRPTSPGSAPKLQGPGEGFRDFVIAEEAARGRPGFLSLVGIDSPGLTSSLAIAEEVDRLLPA